MIDVSKIADLALLELTDEEVLKFSQKLASILEHFEELNELDTKSVKPLVTPTEMKVHLVEDIVEQEFSAEEILRNAPEKSGNLFKVPPVVS